MDIPNYTPSLLYIRNKEYDRLMKNTNLPIINNSLTQTHCIKYKLTNLPSTDGLHFLSTRPKFFFALWASFIQSFLSDTLYGICAMSLEVFFTFNMFSRKQRMKKKKITKKQKSKTKPKIKPKHNRKKKKSRIFLLKKTH